MYCCPHEYLEIHQFIFEQYVIVSDDPSIVTLDTAVNQKNIWFFVWMFEIKA